MGVEVILTDNFPDIIRYTHIQCVAFWSSSPSFKCILAF
ncbi:unnamed protein product [Brassica rapa subsp. trilocularis]|uniref:Uncharacterized protein n=2 Tax=Brassica TaxID=3705 RepID=A0A3P5YGQ4_BRACM|nr:unnamed protein product [Brassica napus]VDC66399.1 unnamed protein product [Brassica rapa]